MLRLLGPVELQGLPDGVELGTPRQRAIVAAMAIEGGRPVSVDTLIDRVWGEHPPADPRGVLYTYLARIRRVLACARGADAPRIRRRSGGYLFDLAPDQVDLHRFRRRLQASREPERSSAEQAALLREAIGLWRGEPLAGIPGEWAARTRDIWRGEHVEAVVAWARAEVAAGNPDVVAGVLKELAAEHPLVESVEAVLMRALSVTGHAAEALDRFAVMRRRMVDDLGVEPGRELQAVHQSILRGEPGPAPPRNPEVEPVGAPLAQLPADVRGFAGRGAELSRMDAVLASAGPEPSALVILAITGTAGVGKTALAVHWAHHIRDRFPDGQLYLNLRGFDPAGPPLLATEALRVFLRALGVTPQRIPADLASQAALYRSVLSGRRMLILLDNGRDADQVRPLLPGEPSCLVVVTSRNQLTGLTAAEGAQPLVLDVLPAAEARDLLARRVGEHRIEAEPEAVDDVIGVCAGLPLALAIAAARAATYAGFSLTTVAAELDDARHGLDMFTGSDRATNARAVFSWSYRTLRPAAATLFRLLTLHPGPDAGIGAVSSLAGLPVGETRVLLAELLDANLLGEQPAARFRYHDLLRAYGRELAHQLDTEADRRAAEHRVLDHYLHTALAADRLLYPHRPPIRHVTAPLVRGVTPEPLADMPAALAWFTTEYQNLRAAVERAATAGFGTHAWLLPWTLATFLERQGNDRDWLACIQIGLSAAERSGDRAPQALAHYGLGYANLAGGHPDLARTHLTTARDLCRELGDLGQLARVHLNLGVTARMQGRYADALDEADRALEIYLGLDDPIGQARALNNMGWCHITLGNHEQAMSYCQRAVAMHEAAGNQSGAAHSWDSVGHVHHHTGRHRDAIDCYQRALNLFRELGDRPFEAIIWTHLGDTHAAAGDAAAAREARLRALDIFTEIDHPDADRLRATLRGEPDPTKTERAPPARTGLRHW